MLTVAFSLVLGSINGALEPAFKKIATLHAKNDFSFVLITGNLFGLEDDQTSVSSLLDGAFNIPVTTYFTVGTTPLPAQLVERIEQDQEVGHERMIHICSSYYSLVAVADNFPPCPDLREPPLPRQAKRHQNL